MERTIAITTNKGRTLAIRERTGHRVVVRPSWYQSIERTLWVCPRDGSEWVRLNGAYCKVKSEGLGLVYEHTPDYEEGVAKKL